jgi:hypothetical protein
MLSVKSQEKNRVLKAMKKIIKWFKRHCRKKLRRNYLGIINSKGVRININHHQRVIQIKKKASKKIKL